MNLSQLLHLHGAPGSAAHWAPSAKTGVGTALNPVSQIWFTLNSGIVTEVFYPTVDSACTRDLGLLITDRHELFSEEKSDTTSEVSYLADGVPAFRVVNTCAQDRYRVEKQILTDSFRPTLLQQIRFTPLTGALSDYSVYVLLHPHIDNQGAGNTAWVGDFKGVPMLFAQRNGMSLALACSWPWHQRSAGFVGPSDGWHDLAQHKQLTQHDRRAENGNVALIGEVDLAAGDGQFLLALGFGRNEGEAGCRAWASLLQGFEKARSVYLQEWTDWQKNLLPLGASKTHRQDLYRISVAVMRTHEDKHFAGGIAASLSIPWGASKTDGHMGYHRLWPRDMIQTVGSQLAIQQHEDARRVLAYLQVTQEADGHWPQNMFTNGQPSWKGIQLDETAFAILLVDLAHRELALGGEELAAYWPMVRRAAAYLVCHGPVTALDRWEEEAGYFASTMAVEIPALLIAAGLADQAGEPDVGAYLRETADTWYAMIDRLLYVTDSELARRAGVEGYYARFALPDQMQASTPAAGHVTLRNHPKGAGRHAVAEIVSPDALYLVRTGLRAANDSRMVNTVRVIDMLLKVDTPEGPGWHRYNDDGYGEHADGSPFDGTGIGRLWPLLTGERAHYELAAGHRDEAQRLLHVMERLANESGLLPEQIWDSADIPARGLRFGRPTGSAMPLVWAHAEYVKLRRSLHDGKVFDTPPQSVERYLMRKTESPRTCWRIDQPCGAMTVGKVLRLEVLAPAVVSWSCDGKKALQKCPTRDTKLGMHLVDLPTEKLSAGSTVEFTFHWLEKDCCEGRKFSVTLEQEPAGERFVRGK